MKFRVERDVLADAVAWAARSLPVRPSVPVLAGLLIETGRGRRRPAAVDVRLRDLRAGHAARRRSRTRARRWSPAGCSPTSAAACRTSRSRWPSTAPRSSLTCGSARFSLQTMPVEEYPSLPGHAEATGTVRSDVFADAVAQAVTAAGRDDMLPVLTGVRIEIEGAHDLAAGHRPLPALAARARRGTPAPPTSSAAALVPAKVLADTAKSLTSGSEVTIALVRLRRRRGHHRLRGRGRRRRTTDHHPAARRRVPQGPHAVPRRARAPSRGSTGPPWSSRSSGSRWSPSATPPSSWRSPTAC